MKVTEREINFDLLDKILRKIARNPKIWNQRYWAIAESEDPKCGTAMCLAGWAVVMDKGEKPNKLFIWEKVIGTPYRFDNKDYSYIASWIVDNGMIEGEAVKILGLTREQAEALFDRRNTLKDLRAMVKALKKNPKMGEIALDELRSSRK